MTDLPFTPLFAYNFMVTTIRAIMQELDGFATRYATQIDHAYVENRNLEEKIADALKRAGQPGDEVAVLARQD